MVNVYVPAFRGAFSRNLVSSGVFIRDEGAQILKMGVF